MFLFLKLQKSQMQKKFETADSIDEMRHSIEQKVAEKNFQDF
jgi:hypothetical protein